MKKLLFLLLLVLFLVSLTGCSLFDGIKKDIEEAKEDLGQAGEFVQELRNRDDCLHTALSDGTAAGTCPGAGD